MSLTITLAPELETQVRSAAKQEGLAPDIYVGNLLQLHLQQQRLTVTETEERLLQQINLGLSEETWQRHHLLATKLQDETLQVDEQQEFLQLTNQLENANVRRIEALDLFPYKSSPADASVNLLGVEINREQVFSLNWHNCAKQPLIYSSPS